MKINKLTVLASMSGGGKSTYANNNYSSKLIFPDTNVDIYKMYHELFRTPALEQGLEPDKLTGLTLWGVKYMSDMTFLNGLKIGEHYNDLPRELVNMRSGWDFLIYDEIWQGRKIISEELMFKYVNNIESQFKDVNYMIWDMQDEKIIEELMSRDDDRAHLFNSDPKVYQEWQKHFVSRYLEIMDKFKYDYELKVVKYT